MSVHVAMVIWAGGLLDVDCRASANVDRRTLRPILRFGADVDRRAAARVRLRRLRARAGSRRRDAATAPTPRSTSVVGSPAPAGPSVRLLLPPAHRLPAADAALRDSGALGLADELVAPHHLDHALDHIQVALNIPPYPHRPGAPHIDGHRPDEKIGSFTMLAAIFLTDESTPDRGNLWVWPARTAATSNCSRAWRRRLKP